MGVVADLTVPVDAFALPEALPAHPEMTIEAERLASHSTEWVLPFLWASGGNLEAFHESLQDDLTVSDAAITEASDDSVLYKIHWTDDVISIVNEMTDQHASILEASAQRDAWRLQLRFAEEGQVSSFQEYFTERDQNFTVNRLSRPASPREREFGLTTEQRDTLVAALQQGYFNIPRDLSLDELSEQLNLSSNAVSQRIRRASATLIEQTLLVGTTDEE